MRDKWIALAGLGLLHSLTVVAENLPESATEAEPVAAVQIGAATEAILDLQRSQLTAVALRPMQGEHASRAYQRYLDSFRQPMPATGDGISASSGKAVTGGK